MSFGLSHYVRAVKPLDPVYIKGNHFFYANGTQFFVRGVTYAPASNGIADVLSDASNCYYDALAIAALGANVVIITGVDITKDHTYCMQCLQAAGLYVVLSLSSQASTRPTLDLAYGSLFSTPSWNDDIYSFYIGVVDAFASFTNVIGFSVSPASTVGGSSFPFVRAATRDLKAYIKVNKYREIALTSEIYNLTAVSTLASFLRCGRLDESLDFWVILNANCIPNGQIADFQAAGANYGKFNMPLVFRQAVSYCPNSTYTWVGAFGDSQVSSFWSGNIADYWRYGGSAGYAYGLYNYTSYSKTTRYTSLSKAWQDASPTGIQASGYTPAPSQTTACVPQGTSTNLPPLPNRELCDCMMSSVNCAFPSTIPDDTLISIIAGICKANSTNCVGIMASGYTGIYGAYSGCKAYQQVSWAINRYAINAIAVGNSTACNISTYAKVQSLSVSPSCSSMVLAAGVLGTNTVRVVSSSSTAKPLTSTITIDGANSDPTSSESPPRVTPGRNKGHYSPAVYGVIAAGCVIVLAIIIGALMCRKRITKKRISSAAEGLQVGEAPFALGNVKNVELGGESRKSELWTNRNTTELPCLEVDVLDVGARGSPEGHTLLPPVEVSIDADDDNNDDIHGGEIISGEARGSESTSTRVDEARGSESTSTRVDEARGEEGKISRKEIGSGKREKDKVVRGDREVAEEEVEADWDREVDERTRFTSSWGDGAWFDPNDARQVLSPGGTTVVRRGE